MVTLDRGIDVRNLFGGKFLPQEMVLQSMGMLEQRLTAEFHQRSRLNAEIAQQARKASARLLDQVRGDQGAAAAVAKLRSIGANIRDRELRDPHRAEVKEGVYAGSIGAVVKPPYDYQWTWSAVSGNPADNTEVANKSSGKMSLVFDTDESDNSSSISGRAAVGIYFYPPQTTARCRSGRRPHSPTSGTTSAALIAPTLMVGSVSSSKATTLPVRQQAFWSISKYHFGTTVPGGVAVRAKARTPASGSLHPRFRSIKTTSTRSGSGRAVTSPPRVGALFPAAARATS